MFRFLNRFLNTSQFFLNMWTDIITDHSFLIAILLVGGFSIWKFIVEPIMNEDKSLHENDLDEPSQ